MFTGVKVFSATKAKERDDLGRAGDALAARERDLEIVDRTVMQSSDNEFHCLTVVLFYKPRDGAKKLEVHRDLKRVPAFAGTRSKRIGAVSPSATAPSAELVLRHRPGQRRLRRLVVLRDAQRGHARGSPRPPRRSPATTRPPTCARLAGPRRELHRPRDAGERLQRMRQLERAVRARRGLGLQAALHQRVPARHRAPGRTSRAAGSARRAARR